VEERYHLSKSLQHYSIGFQTLIGLERNGWHYAANAQNSILPFSVWGAFMAEQLRYEIVEETYRRSNGSRFKIVKILEKGTCKIVGTIQIEL